MKKRERQESANNEAATVTNPRQSNIKSNLVLGFPTYRFSIVSEVEANRHLYTGDSGSKELTLRNVATVIELCLDRISQEFGFRRQVAPTTLVSCCLKYGVERLRQEPSIRELIKLTEQYHGSKLTLENIPTGDYITPSAVKAEFDEMAHDVMKRFSTEKIEKDGTGNRLRVFPPAPIRSMLAGLSSDLGIPESSLAQLCLYLTLVEQERRSGEILRTRVNDLEEN
jgi:hypothetical protein